MKNSSKIHKTRGVSLVAAIAIMVIMSVLGIIMVSMLGTTSRGSVDYQRSAGALGLAQAGLNWYMVQLAGISDWTTTTNQIGVSLAPGTFDVTLSNQTSTRIDISVTGKVMGSDGVTIQRTMSQRVWKLPSASKFALFWGRLTGSNLTLTNTAVNGDMWSRGITSIPSSSSVSNGIAYRPDNQDITGAGTYTEQAVTSPYPVMPGISPAYYTNLIGGYNTMIGACGNSNTINQNTNLVLTGNTICCQTFNTNTTANSSVTISGNGFIVANQNINLNTSGSNGRTLTISPLGGNIVFLAGTNLTVNNGAGGNHPVTGSSSASSQIRMYARSASSTTQLLTINNTNTNINGALFLANRRILVRNGANLTNSTLFVNDPGSAINNNLTVTGLGTDIGTLVGPCNLISIGRGSPSLAITTTANVVGLIYQRDANNLGYTNIQGSSSASRVNITGSLVANQFTSNRIINANITYNPTAIADPPREGFDGFATKKPNSWSGN